ncbi:hypothetical protein [Nocardia sp. NPDC059228]|uniref:hypothetical protein n=1 Tax=Nocardia sp. NPDC059228 TaxID=3346777 RepID=UPI0036B7C798
MSRFGKFGLRRSSPTFIAVGVPVAPVLTPGEAVAALAEELPEFVKHTEDAGPVLRFPVLFPLYEGTG